MQIDWFTVAAQVVNFLILVYLLRRFLYQPVMRAMARREEAIAQRLQDAETREQVAAQEASQWREQTAGFEREREARLASLAQEVDTQRKSMFDEARREVEADRARWQQDMARERQDLVRQFKPRAAAALSRAARRMLSDMADVELEQQLIRTFVRKLESLDHAELAALRKSAHKAGRLRVTLSFEADADTRARIRRAVQHHLLDDRETEVDFHRADSLICGIELNAGGRKLGWTVDNYLQALEDELGAPGQELRQPQESAGA